jgi:hypothetical protein
VNITGDNPMMGSAKWALCSLCDNKILPSVATTNVGHLLQMASNNRWALGWFFNIYNHGSQNLKNLSNETNFYKAAAYFMKTAGLENVKSQTKTHIFGHRLVWQFS